MQISRANGYPVGNARNLVLVSSLVDSVMWKIAECLSAKLRNMRYMHYISGTRHL